MTPSKKSSRTAAPPSAPPSVSTTTAEASPAETLSPAPASAPSNAAARPESASPDPVGPEVTDHIDRMAGVAAAAHEQPYRAEDLQALAQALNRMAEVLPVDAPGEDGLVAMRWSQSLAGAASNLLLMAVQDYAAQTEAPLVAVLDATEQAREALTRIRRIDRTVEVVGDVLLLATVIWLQKWNLVLPTLRELRSDLQREA